MAEPACDLVLVACDFSSGSCAAAHFAACEVAGSGKRLLLVHVVSEDAEVDLPPTAEQDAFRSLFHFAASLKRRHGPLGVDVEIHRGDPVDVIQQIVSTRAIVLVVAGAARVHRALPFNGGVALRLAACVTAPVVLVAPEAEVRGGAEL